MYQSVILKERKGEYLGKTVQVVPHITDEIQVRLKLNRSSTFSLLILALGFQARKPVDINSRRTTPHLTLSIQHLAYMGCHFFYACALSGAAV